MGSEEQAIIFGAGIVCGLIGGIGADGYRAWRSAVRIGRAASIISDCLCWCVLAVFVFAMLFLLNGGDLRSYFFAALLAGYLIYRHLAGERVVRMWQWQARIMRRIVRALLALLVIVRVPMAAVGRWGSAVGRWLKRLFAPKGNSPPSEKN